MSKATILAVQKQLKARNTTEATKNRGAHIKISEQERAKIGGYAARNGITAAIRYFRRNHEYADLKESTVRGWKNQYCEELKARGKKY